MYTITDTEIRLTKGDSFYCEVTMEKDGDTYTPQEGDKIRFAVKKAYQLRTVLIDKDIPLQTQVLYLKPEDTKRLPVGTYVYDIELTYANGDVDTFISGQFILLPEVK